MSILPDRLDISCKYGHTHREHSFKSFETHEGNEWWEESCDASECTCEDFRKLTNFDILERAAET